MKKQLLVLFAIFVATCMFFACSDSNQEIVKNFDVQQKLDNKTLMDLKAYNMSLSKPNQTRGFFRRLIALVSADISGAGKAITHNAPILTITTAISKTAGAVVGSAIAIYGAVQGSYKSKKKTDGILLETLHPNDSTVFAYSTHYISSHILSAPNNNVYLVPGKLDTLEAYINIPNRMSHLKKIGPFHNEILSNLLPSDIEEEIEEGINSNPIEELDDPDQNLVSEISNIICSADARHLGDSLVSNVIEYCTTTGYAFREHLQAYPYASYNVNETYKLFLTALELSAQSTSDVINIVNNYINIIEQDNDFSEAEREQLYAGMVVAVYSFKFWYEKYTEPILFQ